jgi:hypothetical protein
MTNPNSINPDLREWDLDKTLEYVAEMMWDEHSCDFITPEQEFRYPCCGFGCALTEKLLHGNGITDTQTIGRQINYSASGIELDREHNLLKAITEEGEFFFDPSYSQFFDAIGLDLHMIDDDSNPFPKERVIIFKEEDVEDLITWLTDVARMFWQNHNHSSTYLARHFFSPQDSVEEAYLEFYKPPLHMTDEELRAYFGYIYDLSAYAPIELRPSAKEESEEVYSKLTVDTSGAYL